jgi:hypothetical protein
MSTQTTIKRLRKQIYSEYASSVGLDPEARYLHGTPLRPVVPLDAATGGVLFIGAYPSARFMTIEGVRDVPVADNLGPFESERWFDGGAVRSQRSADELEEHFLTPLRLSRSDCWVTDLVKVFLFKPGHRKKYAKLGAKHPSGYERERFEELGKLSLPWIYREIAVARPRLVITLGAEVAAVVRARKHSSASSRLLGPPYETLSYGKLAVLTAHLAHPGILMRGDSTKWLGLHRGEHLPSLDSDMP